MRKPHTLAAAMGSLLMVACASNPMTGGSAPSSSASMSDRTEVPVAQAQPAWARTDPKMDAFVSDLMARMTLQEKIGQLTLLTSNWESTGPTMRDSYKDDIRAGRVGAIFNAYTADYTAELQRLSVEETRLKIPLLFGYDVIHGHRTIFPISLGEAASWDMEAIERAARLSAVEASAEGIHWI